MRARWTGEPREVSRGGCTRCPRRTGAWFGGPQRRFQAAPETACSTTDSAGPASGAELGSDWNPQAEAIGTSRAHRRNDMSPPGYGTPCGRATERVRSPAL